MGVGIHGEPGRRRAKLVSADEIVEELLGAVVPDLPFVSGDRVALMINGLGGTPISELYLLYGQAHKRLAEQGTSVGRSYVGEYCTSLDMAGASITLVKLDDEIVEVTKWDVVRVPTGTWRGYEAGPEGLEVLVFGAPNLGEDPREDVDGQRDWWAD